MAGTSNYPGALDDFAEASPTNLGDEDSTGRTHSERHDDIEAAMEAVQGELGTDPSGASASTVAARFTTLDSTVAGKVAASVVTTAGDLIVGAGSASVTRLGKGTEGYVLTSSSAGAQGLIWAEASGGATVEMSPTEPVNPDDGTLWVDTDSNVPTFTASAYVLSANPTITGVATFAAGTVSAPAITTTGDPNTGIFFPAADTVAIAEGGVEVLRVNSSGQVSVPDGSASAPSITNTGDTDTGIAFPADNTVAVSTAGSERFRVDANGRTVFGHTAAITAASSNTPPVQVHGTSVFQTGYSATFWAADNNAPQIQLNKSRGASIGTRGTVNDTDEVGRIVFAGDDGTNFVRAAMITAAVNGTPGSNDMPGALSFFTTADGSGTPTERQRIDANGLITGTGTSLGAWTTYTPTLAGTGWAIGNGTASGYYCQIGKVMFIRVSITFGNTSTFGAGGLTCSLPANANGNFPAAMSGIVRYVDSSASAIYAGHGGISSNTFAFQYFNTNGSGQLSAVTSTSAPFTWADTDIIRLTMAYEIA